MKNSTKILFAIADKETEEYLATVIKEDCPNSSIIGVVTYKEKLIQKVSQLEPDILILRETLPGAQNISEILFELRYSYPNVRIIFLGGDRKPGDPLLVTLVTYGVYDLLVGGNHKISDVIELINIPNEFKDVNYLIPKGALNEITNSMSFEQPPIVVASKRKEIVVVEDNEKYDKQDRHKGFSNRKNNHKFKKNEQNNNLSQIEISADENANNSFNYNDEFEFEFDDNLGINEDTFQFSQVNYKDDTDLMADVNQDDLFDIDFEDFSTDSIKEEDCNTEVEMEFEDIDLEYDEKPSEYNNINQYDDDLMLEIDLNNIKDNKDRTLDDILFEEEGDDIILFEDKTSSYNSDLNDNEVIDEKDVNLKKKFKNKYSIENNSLVPNNTTISDVGDLESLTKEIEQMREDDTAGIEIYNEVDLNNTSLDDDYEEDLEKNATPFRAIISKNTKPTLGTPQGRQKIISFIGGKNGVGTSSVAVNTAVTLANQDHNVIYIEINTIHPTIGYWYQIGHVNQGIETAVKAVEKGELNKIDKSIIKTSELKKQNKKMYKSLPDKLDFLLFSKQETILKDSPVKFNPDTLKDLFLILMIELNYDYVILDLDFDLSNVYTTTSLNFSNIICPVVTQDMSSLAYLLFKIEEIERSGRNIKNKCRYIINRYEGNNVEITLRDIKEWLDSKKVSVIPECNRDFINANTLSIPVVSYTKNEKIIKGFNDITKDILLNDLK